MTKFRVRLALYIATRLVTNASTNPETQTTFYSTVSHS